MVKLFEKHLNLKRFAMLEIFENGSVTLLNMNSFSKGIATAVDLYIVIFHQEKVYEDFHLNIMVVFPIFWK